MAKTDRHARTLGGAVHRAADSLVHAQGLHDHGGTGHRRSVPEQKNADDSVTVRFGPETPAGKESNWIPTSASGGFEVLFRFYGPEKPLFEKTWVLPDIEPVRR